MLFLLYGSEKIRLVTENYCQLLAVNKHALSLESICVKNVNRKDGKKHYLSKLVNQSALHQMVQKLGQSHKRIAKLTH